MQPNCDKENYYKSMKRELYFFWFLFFLIFSFSIYLRIPVFRAGITSMRQATSAAIARNLYEDGFSPQNIKSRVHSGFTKNFVSWRLEFPTYHYLVALSYFITGVSEVNGRIINFSFFLLGCLFIYLLFKRYLTWQAGLISCGILLLSPLSVYYFSNFQRVGLILFSLLGFVYFWTRFLDEERRSHLLLAAAFGAHASLLHYSRAFIIMPFFLITTFSKYGKLSFRKKWAYYFLPLTGIVPFLYLLITLLTVSNISNRGSVNPGLREFDKLHYYVQWINKDFFIALYKFALEWGICVTFIPFVAIALTWPFRLKSFLLAFLAGVFFFMIFDSYPFFIVVHHYYFLEFITALSLLAGAGTWVVISKLNGVRRFVITFLFFVILSTNSRIVISSVDYEVKTIRENYKFNLIGRVVKRIIPDRECRKILMLQGDPITLAYKMEVEESWQVLPESDPVVSLKKAKESGALYLVMETPNSENDFNWYRHMIKDYKVLYNGKHWILFDLYRPPKETMLLTFEFIHKIKIPWVLEIIPYWDKIYFRTAGKPYLFLLNVDKEKRNEIEVLPVKLEGIKDNQINAFCFVEDKFVSIDNHAREMLIWTLNGEFTKYKLQESLKVDRMKFLPERNLLVVSDLDSHSIRFFDLQGKQKGSFGSLGSPNYPDRFYAPGKLDFFKDTLYVADRGGRRILGFGKDGRLCSEVGENTLFPLKRPSSFCITSKGFMFVACDITNKVYALDETGSVIGNLDIEKPASVAFIEKKSLLFVSSEPNKESAVLIYRVLWGGESR